MCRDNSVHIVHTWINSLGEKHEATQVTKEDGEIIITHYKRDNSGRLVRVDDCEETVRDPPALPVLPEQSSAVGIANFANYGSHLRSHD